MKRIAPCLALLFISPLCFAEEPKQLTDVAYGSHPRQVLDFYQAKADNREKVLKWIQEYSPIEHVSKDDPPIGLFYGGEVPVVGASPKDPTHSGIMGVKLEERLKAANVDVVLVHPGVSDPKYKTSTEYLIDRLTK